MRKLLQNSGCTYRLDSSPNLVPSPENYCFVILCIRGPHFDGERALYCLFASYSAMCLGTSHKRTGLESSLGSTPSHNLLLLLLFTEEISGFV